jgi:hypothetical protein
MKENYGIIDILAGRIVIPPIPRKNNGRTK